jgi:hypothetical protein
VVIDDQGRACGGVVQRTLCELQGSLSHAEYIDYLTINCGFAAIQVRDQSIHIHFRPDMLGGKALAELMFQVYDTPWRRALATTFVDGTWHHTILPADRVQVIGRLSDIVMESQTRSHRAVLRRNRSAQSLPRVSPMAMVWREWRKRPESPSRTLRCVLADEIGGRYVWVGARDNGDLVMEEVGGGFPQHVVAALQPGIGHRLQDQPDVVFGRYCAEAYGAAAKLRVPMLEDVDAIMTPPEGERFRRRYARLILPFRSPAGGVRLLGVSFEDTGIDLRSRAS